MRLPIPALLLAASLCSTACTTLLYEGPERPDHEVATLVSERTCISTIDGVKVPYSGGNYATFKILPGLRTIGVCLNDVGYPYTRTSSQALPVVINAEGGKTYVTRPVYSGKQWRPEIIVKPAPDKSPKE